MNQPTKERGSGAVFGLDSVTKSRAWKNLRELYAALSNRTAFGRFQRNRTADISAQLTGFAVSLADLTRKTEPDFVHLANDLKALYSCASELCRTTGEHLHSIRTALESSCLTGSNGLANRSLGELRAGLDKVDRGLNSLTSMGEAMARLHDRGQQMERVAMFLTASGCSFAVETARTPACQQSFGAFVEEFRKLAKKIGMVGNTIAVGTASTRSELFRLTRAINEDFNTLKVLTQSSETAIQQTSERVQQLLDSSLAALKEAESRTRNISRHADDAVYHLQFGDIVRQKLEHVSSALAEAATHLASREPREPARANHILAIQSSQLALIHTEIESARTQLAMAFTGLAEETGNLVSNVHNLGESNVARTDATNHFEHLRSDLLHVEKLRSQGHDLSEQARATSQEAFNAASKLSRHLNELEEINGEMQLQALNAIIKTAWLGEEGQALGVLSSFVHTSFQNSEGLFKETAEILAKITAQALDASRNTSDDDTDADNGPGHGMESLSDIRDDFRRITSSALALSKDQQIRLKQAHGRLEFISLFAAQISTLVKELSALRANLGTMKGSMESSDELGSLLGSYTMESERAVHRRYATAGASASLSSEGVTAEIQDNPTPPSETSRSCGTIVQAKQFANGETPGAEKEGDLGDNIELF